MDHERVVTVEISGQRYPIRSNLDANYVAELAAYVDQKMQLAQHECPSGDTLRLAILAALNIADECFRVRDEDATRQRTLAERADDLERMLDLALGTPDTADSAATPPLARTAGSF